MSHPFVQLIKLLTFAASANALVLKARCIRPSVYALKVNSAVNLLKATNETKNALVIASMGAAERTARFYTKRTLFTPAVMNAAKRGLVKAVNRFDFNSTAKFTSYAKW